MTQATQGRTTDSVASTLPTAGERLYWKPVVGGFAGAFFGPGLFLATNSIFLNDLRSSTDWSFTALSFAPALQFVFIGLAGPFVGQACNRFGVKRVFSLGALMLGAGVVLLSQVANVWQFIGLHALLGFAITMVGMVPITVMISSWFDAKRGTALGITFAGPAIAGFVFSPVVGPLIESIGWRQAYVVLGIAVGVPLLLISLVCIGSPSTGGPKQQASEPTGDGLELSEALRTRPFWLLAIAGLLFQTAFGGVLTHVVPFAADRGVVGNPGIALALLLAVGILGRFGMGLLVDRFGAKPVFIATFSTVAASLLCVVFSAHIAMFWLFVILFGVSSGGMITVPALLVARLFGTRAVGQIIGVYLLVGTLGALLGPPVGGGVREITESYDLAIIGWTAAVAIGIFLATRIPNPDAR